MAVGTTAALVGASIGGSLIQASAAKKAAGAQADAAGQQTALQREIYEDTSAKFQPWLDAGNVGLNALMYELGLGEAPTIGGTPLDITTNKGTKRGLLGGYNPDTYSVGGQTFASLDEAQQYANANPTGGMEYQGYELTPGYKFQIDEGINALDQSAASRGQLNSSWAMNNAQRLGQGIAQQGYEGYLNRLASMSASGQGAAGNQAQAGQAYASGASNALANMGNAQAAGYIGVGNAVNSGIQNGLGIWQYQNTLAGNQSLFGGNSWG